VLKICGTLIAHSDSADKSRRSGNLLKQKQNKNSLNILWVTCCHDTGAHFHTWFGVPISTWCRLAASACRYRDFQGRSKKKKSAKVSLKKVSK
jgi:hypothetical protein